MHSAPRHDETGIGPADPGRDRLPGLDVLAARSAQGDRAAFAAFYDTTSPWIHAMAVGIFADERDAAEATVQTYCTAWERVDEGLDELDVHEDADRHRTVHAWLAVLAHDVMTRLVRTGSLPGHDDGLLPIGAGPAPVQRLQADGPARGGHLIDAPEHRSVLWAWLGGRTVEQIAAQLGTRTAEAKAELHRSVRELIAAQRGRPTPTGAAPQFADDVGELGDRANVLAHAELAALDALAASEAEALHAAVFSTDAPGPGGATLWRSRQRAARSAVTWACRSRRVEPPSHVLDEVLRRLAPREPGSGHDAAPARTEGETAFGRGLALLLAAVFLLLVTAVVLGGLLLAGG